jgi:O-antigen ligase
LPFRIPLHSGGESANLLVPLYLVIAAGAISSLLATRRQEPGGEAERAWLPRLLALAAVLYALQAAYSSGFGAALQDVCFFLVPFAVGFALLREQRWDDRLLGTVMAVVIAEALAFAVFGYWQHEVRKLLWNEEVINGNEVHTYFRVNSVFFDPNIYGRYIATVMILAVAWLLWEWELRRAVLLALSVAILAGALLLTYSQSSYAALLVGLLVLAALRWSLRVTLVAVAAGFVALVIAVGIGDVGNRLFSSERSLNKGTSGRVDLIRGGLELAGEQPVFGQGSGAFVNDFRRREPGAAFRATAASHTEPVTVIAEQGAIGAIAYLALLAVALTTLWRQLRGLAPGLRGWGGVVPTARDGDAAARTGILAAFIALVVHSLAYDAFLTDPITWVLLAVGLALAPVAVTERDEAALPGGVEPNPGAAGAAAAEPLV